MVSLPLFHISKNILLYDTITTYSSLQKTFFEYKKYLGDSYISQFQGIPFNERAGVRTRDNLIKSQVLYQLSYTPLFL